jgi:hypothetical protein
VATYYGTPAAVRLRTGIGPEDLGLATDGELDAALEQLLAEVTDLLDRRMGRSYLGGQVPPGLAALAADVAADAIRQMIATRQAPVVRIDEFAARVITSRLLTPDVLERLRIYAAGGGARSVSLGLPDVAGLQGDEDG